MNHPTHPEEQVFGGMVRGRDVPDVAFTPSNEYLQGHQDGLEWAAQTAEACDPRTGDFLYDDLDALAAALRKGPEMPVCEPLAKLVPARTLAIVDAHHAKLNEALDAKDAEIARLTAAAVPLLRPVFGAIGSRDVDVAAGQRAFDAALVAAQPAVPIVLQLALDALEYHRDQTRAIPQSDDAIATLRTTIANLTRSVMRKALNEFLEKSPAPAQPAQPAITLDFKQTTELLAMFGGEPSEITLLTGEGHSGKGIYVHYSDYPEEGAEYLGVSDDEAMPENIAQPAVPVTDAGYFYNLVMHALMDVDAPHGGCKARLKDIAEKLEALMIASRGQA